MNEYITGSDSCRALALKYGCSESTVLHRCRAEGWVARRAGFRLKTASKTEDRCSDKLASVAARIYAACDLLLKQIADAAANLKRGDASGILALTRALKDLNSIIGLKSELDAQEQEARIALLRKQAEQDERTDTEIRVVIDGVAKEFSE